MSWLGLWEQGPWAVVAASWGLFVLLLLTGRIFTKVMVDKLLAQHDKLSATVEKQAETVDELSKVVAQLPRAMQTSTQVLTEIQDAGKDTR